MIPEIGELADWLARREALVPALREGAAKRIDWAGRPGERTPLAVVYLHGFSASPREVSPYTERLAAGLGANLFATRLAGHGVDGAAMGVATLAAWRADVAEALSVGRTLGERVLAVACSTGGTLLALALAGGEEVAGAVMLSPNFGTRSRRAQMALDLPFAAAWAPYLGERGMDHEGEKGLVWTARFPITAFIPMAQAVRRVRRADLDAIRAPTLFAFADADRVVEPRLTRAAMARWGGPVAVFPLEHGPADDPMRHVPAGLLSPGLTDGLVEATVEWAARTL